MRRLIINADDFGLTQGVNRAILECGREGVVTSATLMANGEALGDAIGALQTPSTLDATGLAVGCHIGLVDGTPLLPAAKVSSLLGDGTGAFRSSIIAFGYAATAGRIRAEQIEAEAVAQIRKLQGAGVRLSHFDAHKHAHMFPFVLQAVLRAAQACGIGAMRNPFEPAKPFSNGHLLGDPALWKRYAEVKLLRVWARDFRRAAAAAGIATTDGTFGIAATGALNERVLEAMVAVIPEGTWELCCHPGCNDQDLAQAGTRLLESRERERQLFRSDYARELLARYDIERITYWDLR